MRSTPSLFRLWDAYLAAVRLTEELHKPYQMENDAFEAKHGDRPPRRWEEGGTWETDARCDAWRDKWLVHCERPEHRALWGAWSDSCHEINVLAEKISNTPAMTLAGIGIKLAATPDSVSEFPDDYENIVASVLDNVAVLTGRNFPAALVQAMAV